MDVGLVNVVSAFELNFICHSRQIFTTLGRVTGWISVVEIGAGIVVESPSSFINTISVQSASHRAAALRSESTVCFYLTIQSEWVRKGAILWRTAAGITVHHTKACK